MLRPTRTRTHEVSPDASSGSDTPETETDAGPPKKVSGTPRDPERRCIATGERGPQSAMVRFALSPDGVVTPDVGARLPGRGAWVRANRLALEAAIAKKAFSRAFKQSVETPENLVEQTASLLFKRCIDLLGFAKRAGDLILGYDQVREEIRSARPACLVEATDGASDGRHKVLALAKAIYGFEDDRGQPPVIGCFSANELGMALGRERVIHAIVKEGRFAQKWVIELGRLGGFRPLRPDSWMSETDR